MAKKRNNARMGDRVKDVAIGAGLRGAGAIAGAGIAHTVVPKILEGKPDNILGKQRGAALVVLGVAAEAFLPDPMLQKVAQGVSAYGAVQMANDNLPESLKAQVKLEPGLSGIGDTGLEISVDWNRLAQEAESTVNGMANNTPAYSNAPARKSFNQADLA